jgi:hypothetical protein
MVASNPQHHGPANSAAHCAMASRVEGILPSRTTLPSASFTQKLIDFAVYIEPNVVGK